MTDPDTTQALERIGRALSRIEDIRTADRAMPSDPRLPERHERLRTQVRETLDRLDALIAEQEA